MTDSKPIGDRSGGAKRLNRPLAGKRAKPLVADIVAPLDAPLDAPLVADIVAPLDAPLDAPQPPAPLSGLSWLVSAVFHAAAFFIAALLWNPPPPAGNAVPERRAGIVLVDLSQATPEYFAPGDDDAAGSDAAAGAVRETLGGTAVPASNTPSAQPVAETTTATSDPISSLLGPSQSAPATLAAQLAALPGAVSAPIDAAAVLPSREGVAAAAGAAAAAADSTGGGAGGQLLRGGATTIAGPRGLGKATQTYVFGVPGIGSKFLYLFDRSASMSGFEGRPLAAAKRELATSLRSLESTHQFQIIFYNNRPSVFNPFAPQPPRMVFGEDKNKRLAEDYIRNMTADGGTDHMLAINLALGLAPDVVFYLTDADDPQLTAADLAHIERRNRGIVFNTIEFGAGPQRSSNNFLVRLARQTGGQHAYVDVTQLPR
jgi:hypothetical protein